jgi:hypothetical protein
MKKIVAACILVFIVFTVRGQQHQFAWLIGTWKLQDKNVYEVWTQMPESVLHGKSFRISGSDTTLLEKINLVKRDEHYYYVPEVENKGAVEFKITSYDENSFRAENPAHDFPKLIRYTIVRKQEKVFILAAIEGNGKVIPYTFEKIH